MTDPTTTTTTTTARFAGLTREQIQDFRREYGEDRVKTLSAPAGKSRLEVVVRAPNRDEVERHTEALVKIERKTAQALAANRTLLLSCLLAPPAADAKATLDAYPYLVDKFVEKVVAMAGADAEVQEEIF